MLREQRWRNLCYSFYVVFFFLISIANAKLATIDADGTATYKSFDDFLTKIQSDTNAYVDTVLFIGTNQHTYSVTANVEKDLGKRITFRGNESNPDNFPILNHTANPLYSFFTRNDVHFERISFTGTTYFDNGQNIEDLIFDNCIIKDYTSAFFNLQGDAPRKIFFRNCLFANNTDTIFRLNFWGSPNLQMINCTFDNNKAIFSTDEDASSGFSIVNCIFSNSGALPGNNLKSRTSYSYVQENKTGYGEACVQRVTGDSIYMKAAPRNLPSHWKIKAESGAYKMGSNKITNALSTDLAGIEWGTIYDAGCWKVDNAIQITQKPQSDTVIVDSTATFKVVASGIGTNTLVYAWYRSGSETSISDSSVLSFTAKANLDNTKYYCLIKNGDNVVSTDTVTLRIYLKPVLKNDIAETITLKTGDSAQFSVSADQIGLSYHWYLKGVEVAADTLSPVFKIKAVRKDEHNNAVIYCIVKNPAGEVKSASDTLKISENAPRITTEPSDLTVYDGENASFSVKAEGIIPLSIEYNWYQIKKGETTPKKVGTNNSSLTLTKVSKDTLDGATYYCVVKILGDSTKSRNAILTILENGKPNIVDFTPKLETRVGQSGSLHVIVQGLDCSFKWYKDGVAIPNSDTNVYTISNAAIVNSGTYHCIITNSKGSITTPNIVVTVRNAGEVYNSVNLKGTFIDRTKIKITITNFLNLPTNSDGGAYVDSIGIWFQESKFPSSPIRNSLNLFKIPISVMRAKAGTTDSYDSTLSIIMGDKPCDTLYFIATPFWKKPDTLPLFNTTSGAKVYTCATDIISNPLKIAITQPVVGKVDLKITGIENVNAKEISSVISYYGKAAPYNETIIPVDELGLPSNTFSKTYEDKLFSDKEETVNWGVYLRGIQGNYSPKNEEKVTVGYPIPQNDALLQLDSAIGIGPTRIPLKWTSAIASDSIRIWYGKETVPLVRSFDSLSKNHKYVTTGGSKKSVTLTELSLNTTYNFGLQIKKNIWSSITQNSSASFKTNSSNLEDIKNTLNIKQIDFIESRNIISLKYTIDTAGLGKKYFEIDYTIGKNGYITEKQGDNNPKGIPLKASPKEEYDYEIDLGEDLDFDVTYYIALWVRGSISPDQITDWATPTDDSKKTVRIPSAKWMSIVYFPKKDTITAFENSVIMWKDSTWTTEQIYDDILNFIILPQEKVPEGFIPVSKSVQFNNPLITPALHFGLRYDSIPNGYKKSDINLYEFDITKGIWNIVSSKDYNSPDSIVSVFIRPTEYKNPLILMVDTFRPTVEIVKDNGDSVLTQKNDVLYKIKIRDNTTNVKTVFMYGTGADTLKSETDIIGDDPNDTLSIFRINSEFVNINSGVRALLIVTDGHFTDTINLSRMVYNPNVVFKTEEMKWYPLNIHYELNSVNITQIFDSLSGLEKKYDNTKFRIFKWVSENDNNTKKVEWLEYGISKDKDDLFNLYPGNLVWIKTREAATLVFKNARTLSLKKNYTIKLPAKSWTDFSVPFEFPIKLDDIIETTGGEADFLVFNQWEMNSNKAHTSVLIRNQAEYDPETEVSGENNNVYTVYNPTDKEIDLEFPPLPSVLSKMSLRKKGTAVDWSVIVKGHSKNEELNPLYIGCFSKGVNKTLIPSAPSFGNLKMSIIEDNISYGIHFSGGKSNGFAYRINFENSEKSKQKIECQVVEKISSGFKMQVFNPVKGTIEDGASGFNVDIDGGSNTERWLLIGDDAFLSKFIQTNIGLKFDLLKIYPNPFKGALHIKFTVPLSGVNSVNCLLFDALGRRIWNFKINEIHPGVNTFTWQPGQMSIKKLASGTYFLMLVAKDNKGKDIGFKQSKLMYLSH